MHTHSWAMAGPCIHDAYTNGKKDYSQYFDLAVISQHVNEFYAK